MKIALEAIVLACAEGINGTERRDAALAVVRRLPQEAVVVLVQVLGGLFNVLVRKAGKSRGDERDALLSWRDTFRVAEASPEVMLTAADLVTDHQLGIWDAVILSTAWQAGCRLLLSEELHGGFTSGRGAVAECSFGPPGSQRPASQVSGSPARPETPVNREKRA